MANGEFMEISFDWDNFEASYRRKVYSIAQLENNEQVIHDIAKRYAELIDPWVPYGKTGNLSKFSIEPGGKIVYDPVANNKKKFHYAAVQYYGDFPNRNRKVHRKATSLWDEEADKHIWDEFRKDAAKIIKAQLQKEKK